MIKTLLKMKKGYYDIVVGIFIDIMLLLPMIPFLIVMITNAETSTAESILLRILVTLIILVITYNTIKIFRTKK